MNNKILAIQKKLSTEMLDFIEDDDFPPYGSDEVETCMALLRDFVDEIQGLEVNDPGLASNKVQRLILALNQLNNQYDGCLIETGQREDICELIDLVLTESGYKFEGDITEEWREW